MAVPRQHRAGKAVLDGCWRHSRSPGEPQTPAVGGNVVIGAVIYFDPIGLSPAVRIHWPDIVDGEEFVDHRLVRSAGALRLRDERGRSRLRRATAQRCPERVARTNQIRTAIA